MKITPFQIVGSVLGTLFVILFIGFSDSAKYGWVSHGAFWLMFAVGGVGAVAGFVKYLVRGEPVPSFFGRQPRRVSDLQSPFADLAPRLKVLSILLFGLGLPLFVIGIQRCVDSPSALVVWARTPFTVRAAGDYTLFQKQRESESGKPGQIVLRASAGGVVIHSTLAVGTQSGRFSVQESYQTGGERSAALAKFTIPAPGEYRLLGARRGQKLLLRPVVSGYLWAMIIVGIVLSQTGFWILFYHFIKARFSPGRATP